MTKSDKKTESGTRKGKKGWKDLLPEKLLLSTVQQRGLIVIILAAVLSFIIIPKGGSVPDHYVPGDIASRSIKAPRDLNIPDLELTEKKRHEAAEAVRPLYDYDPTAARDVSSRLVQTLNLLRAGGGGELPPEQIRVQIDQSFGAALDEGETNVLKRLAMVEEMAPVIGRAVESALSPMIVANVKLFQADLEKGVVIRNLITEGEGATKVLENVVDVGQAQVLLRKRLAEVPDLEAQDRRSLAETLQTLLRPNLTFNKNETERRKGSARDEVAPVFYKIKKGEMVVREGEGVTDEQIKKLKAMRDMGSDFSALRMALGLFFSIALMVFVGHRFGMRNVRKYSPDNRDLLFLAVTFVGLFILIKLGIFISVALEGALPYIDSASYYYAFPFAVGAMLVRIVLNSEVALVFCVVSAILIGFLFGNSLFIAIYVLVGSLAGSHWVGQCKERTTLYRAGFWVSVTNLAIILGLHLVAGRSLDLQLIYRLGFGVFSGFFCAVIVTGTIPLVESVFKYSTDIKLLELANMNAPALRELMIQAPGTYHHSVIVGNLVEAAAEAIHANPLMARVAAYYHDIGKIRKPLYFIENVGNQENRHDKLAPSMSALVLTAHVKDGIEMAREAKLGQELIDVIHQHHGTSLIKFFYDRAKNQADPGVQQIDERDYRYPGPKPQTREAALIMLADAVEAASRTLADPTPARIQGMVQKIINNIFIDGQLDECELTLKDLHFIAKSFNRILAGIFHHRIDYPEPAFKEREKEGVKRKQDEDSDREPAKEARDKDAESGKGGSDDLKRLGMS